MSAMDTVMRVVLGLLVVSVAAWGWRQGQPLVVGVFALYVAFVLAAEPRR